MTQSKEYSAVLINAKNTKAWQRGVIQVRDSERTFRDIFRLSEKESKMLR